jgi:hypothetical protein
MDEDLEPRRTACYDEPPAPKSDNPLWHRYITFPGTAFRRQRDVCAMDVIMLLVSFFAFCVIPAGVTAIVELIRQIR